MFALSVASDTLRKSAFTLWLGLIFIQPIEKFTALKYLLAAALLIATLLLVLRERRQASPRAVSLPLALAGLVAAWAVFVSVIGPYPQESLHAMVKDLLIQAELLFCGYYLVRSGREVRAALLAILGGFAVVSLLSAREVGAFLLEQGFTGGMIPRSHDSFWGGYPVVGGVCLPLLVAYAVLFAEKWGSRLLCLGLAGVALVLVALYGSRSPLLVLALTLSGFLAYTKAWRTLLVLALAAGLAGAWVSQRQDLGYLDKYKSLAQTQTYVTDSGLSARLSVWEGMLEVIHERPWLGYGYGWKKLAWVINEGGFAAKWHAESNDKAAYYLGESTTASYGRVNPHNYPLQVVFEIGVPGLLLVVAFWLALLAKAVVAQRRDRGELAKLRLVLMVGIVAYLLSNFANGYWVGGVANIAMALAGMLLALERSQRAASEEFA